jgi:predicted naringenin-chalcone synthase
MLTRVGKEPRPTGSGEHDPTEDGKLLPTCAMLGLGTALPLHAIKQSDAVGMVSAFCGLKAEQAGRLSNLYKHTGIRSRYLAVLEDPSNVPSFYAPASDARDRGPTTAQRVERYDAEARPLATQAASQALDRSGLSRREITHLVTVSCTGFAAPGVDIGLIQSLDLPRTVQRTHLGFMGCHGALNGLQVVKAISRADLRARVLLCAVEVCSVHFQYGWDPEQTVASALFADGAAALVGGPAAIAPTGAWRVAATGSCLLPDSLDAMTWRIGDHGFEMTLSPNVPDLIYEHLRPWLVAWLARNGLELEEVGSWAVHPGGPSILIAVERALDLPKEAFAVSREVLAECGNMSSPTVLFIVERLLRRQAPRPCVALAFGPGLVVEAALFR